MIGTVLTVALLVVPAAPGNAAPSNSGVAALQARIVAESTRIHDLTAQFDAAATEAAALTQQLHVQLAALRRLRTAVAASRSTLTAAALRSYTGAGVVAPAQSAALAPLVSSEYLAIASGNVADHLDAYHLSERRVWAAVALIRREESTARADASQAAADRSVALAAAMAEQRQLVVLEARMAAMPKVPATQGEPVGGGLVAVVRSQTSPPPASAGPSTIPPAAPASTPPSTTPAKTTPPSPAPPSTTPPSTTPPTSAAPASPSAPAPAAGGNAGGVWLQLRMCESGNNYRENTGNGYYGAYQFSEQTWQGLGFPGRPDLEPPAMQDAAAKKLQAQSGWGAWPACSAELGL